MYKLKIKEPAENEQIDCVIYDRSEDRRFDRFEYPIVTTTDMYRLFFMACEPSVVVVNSEGLSNQDAKALVESDRQQEGKIVFIVVNSSDCADSSDTVQALYRELTTVRKLKADCTNKVLEHTIAYSMKWDCSAHPRKPDNVSSLEVGDSPDGSSYFNRKVLAISLFSIFSILCAAVALFPNPCLMSGGKMCLFTEEKAAIFNRPLLVPVPLHARGSEDQTPEAELSFVISPAETQERGVVDIAGYGAGAYVALPKVPGTRLEMEKEIALDSVKGFVVEQRIRDQKAEKERLIKQRQALREQKLNELHQQQLVEVRAQKALRRRQASHKRTAKIERPVFLERVAGVEPASENRITLSEALDYFLNR